VGLPALAAHPALLSRRAAVVTKRTRLAGERRNALLARRRGGWLRKYEQTPYGA